ncbi:hypothetical protein V5799_009203 [Amblyomma americanum]|uniref:LRRCT domain-containing protein n=1 Tax=Amblyomma americanum TaxID=6943 RepID=A0AAQ4FCQ2_AMBAM
MDQNPVMNLSRTALSGVKNLEELHMSNMPRLESVDKGSLWNMRHLALVNMSYNVRLKVISDSALQWIKSPVLEIVVTNNSLQTLDYAFSGLCDAGLLNLDGNPWLCDCKILWMRSCNATQDLRCSGPLPLAGKAIGHVKPSEMSCPLSQSLLQRFEETASNKLVLATVEYYSHKRLTMDKKALLPLSLLVLLASPSAANTKDMCQASGCACTVFDDAGEVFLRCANHSLQRLPEMDGTVVGIDASHNIISELTRFPKLPALEVLDLHFNRISELPASTFSALDSLEVLDLSHNNIAYVRPECFEGLKNLLVLNLTDNFIESLQPKVFGALSSLKKLVLAGNTLKSIDSSWLGSLHKLEHLDLRMLGLRSLPGNVFHELPALKLLELSDNEFEEVPTRALSSAMSLKVLHLEHNPITMLTSSPLPM